MCIIVETEVNKKESTGI